MTGARTATADRPEIEGDLRSRRLSLVLLVTLVLNLAAGLVKLLASSDSGSLALAAGGIDSLFDGAANVIGLMAVRVAARPPDASHPYGHRKFETLVAVGIIVLLFVTCVRLVQMAVPRLWVQDEVPLVEWYTVAAVLVAMVLNLIASQYEARWGRRLRSELLLADAGHTRADAAVSLALVGGLVAIRAGYPLVDPLLALAIAGVIAYVGLGLARDALDVLSDASAVDPDEIDRLARGIPGVVGAHKIRSRGPADAVAVDLHIQVEPSLGIARSHEIGHQVERRLLKNLSGVQDVIVHVEPEWALADSGVAAAVRRVVGRFPVDAHEIHVHRGRRTEVGLHLELDPRLDLVEAHRLAREIEGAVQREADGVDRVVAHIEPRVGAYELVEEAADGRDYERLIQREAGAVDGLFSAFDVEAVRVTYGVRLSARVRASPDLSLADAHALTERLEARLRAEAPELERVTIRLVPVHADGD